MRRLLILVVVMLLAAAPVLAHEGREVGEYVITFGWRVEPAYAGVFNGPELFIEHHDTGEPLEGAEETLELHVQFGMDNTVLTLHPVFGEPGAYTADLIPTRPGDYIFHLAGTLGETEVSEVFNSADGEFSPVEPSTDIMFPPMPEVDDLQAQIDELRAMIEAMSD